jgi:protein arginine kinase activator
LTEIINGKRIEKHLCEQCAQKEGITINSQGAITELITHLAAAQDEVREIGELSCPQCNLSWLEFRKGGLLGCPYDYQVFEAPLAPLIERAQEGATTHTGKLPRNPKGPMDKQINLIRLRQELQEALDHEDYETAAAIRDKIRTLT